MFEVQDIAVSFGGVRAVDDVSFSLAANEIVGIAGPNGSGKTTLLNALTGLLDAGGRVVLDGEPLDLRKPAAIRHRGVLRVFQAPQTVEELTVVENLMLSTSERSSMGFIAALITRPAMWRHERTRLASIAPALQDFGLESLATTEASELTYGQRRLVDLARAVTGGPTVLMLDEPSAGLNDAETEVLSGLLRTQRDKGTAILVIDHKVPFLNGMCDRLMVLQEGRIIASGTPDEVWRDEFVVAAYLGSRSHA